MNKRKSESGEYVREQERKKTTPFYILSCDGGGVRSLAAAQFLLEFEKHMKKIDSSFKIYDFFDMYSGTSAGGIITGLAVYGQKEMSEIVDIYSGTAMKKISTRSFLDSMFGKCRSKPLYDGKEKRKLINDTIGDAIFREVSNGKHMVIPVYDIGHGSRIFYSGGDDSALTRAADVIFQQ
jgi:patatin-like phospholipase/acyl hydrolase